jgi:hypothetical protein
MVLEINMKLIDYIFYKICKVYKSYNETDPEIYAIGAIPLIFFINFYIIKLTFGKLNLYEIKISSFSIITFFVVGFLTLGIKHYAIDRTIKEVNNIKIVVGVIQYIVITCLTLLFFISMNLMIV